MDFADLMTKADVIRKKLGEDSNSPIDIFTLAQNIENLTLVYYPMGNNISGMCLKDKDDNCVIAINSLMTLGRQRFSLAHEFYHYYYDNNMMNICSKIVGSGEENEKKADAFAAYLLMPRTALYEKVESLKGKTNNKLNLQDIIKIEQYFKVSHQTALYQLLNCRFITKNEFEQYMNVYVRREAELMGFDSDLYRPTIDSKQYYTYGKYLDLTKQMLDKGLISDGKYEELLLDAFRADLVYGFEESGEVID